MNLAVIETVPLVASDSGTANVSNVMLTLDDPMQIETISRLLKQAPGLAADTVQEDHVGPEELLSSSARSLVVRLLELEPQKREPPEG